MALFAEPAIDACVVFDQTSEEPDHVRETIQVSEHLRLDHSTAFHEANSAPFGAATNGAGDLIGRRLGMSSRKRPVGEDTFSCFDCVDEIG
jgi:hypothetical protein